MTVADGDLVRPQDEGYIPPLSSAVATDLDGSAAAQALLHVINPRAIRPSDEGLTELGYLQKRTTEDTHFDNHGSPERRGTLYKGIVAHYDRNFDTVTYEPRDMRADAQVAMPLFHGFGADHSHSGAMFPLLQILTDPKTERSPDNSMIARAQKLTNYVPAVGVAIDLPAHGGGPRLSRRFAQDPNMTVDWLAAKLMQIKARFSPLPLVPLGRSGSPGFLILVNQRYPGLLDGMVLMSPQLPDASVLRHVVERLYARESSGEIKRLNYDGLNWAQQIFGKQMHWHLEEDPFQGLPTLVLIGGADPETPESARQMWHDIVERSPNAVYAEVPNAGHDVTAYLKGDKKKLEPVSAAASAGALAAIYDLVRRAQDRAMASFL